ncbi:hypothetical protein ACIBIZ_15140, partial [Nonomuraea spiralis]|uniref:hypothetical protein n=1 Tax=Nonomuraea spiralis TaxID=46182 RepID=UPI0037961040
GHTGDDATKLAPAKATTSDDILKIDKCGWSTRRRGPLYTVPNLDSFVRPAKLNPRRAEPRRAIVEQPRFVGCRRTS